jgi:tRNA pseudouridine38-40 synthase
MERPVKRRRLALWVSYLGRDFVGFQKQPKGRSVQGELELALAACGVASGVVGAGRTDKGVHARMQVVGVRAPLSMEPAELQSAVNARLSPDLRVEAVAVAHPSFHPQWSATGKEYHYRLDLGRTAGWEGQAWRVMDDERLGGRSVDLDLVERLLGAAVGTRDFIAFHEKSSPRKPRTLEAFERSSGPGEVVHLRFVGSGFAKHQVRFLVGSALRAAAGLLAPEAFLDALENGTALDGMRAPAEGLLLWEVRYPPALEPFRRTQSLMPK